MYNKHHFTEGEKKCMEDYFKYASKTPRKNLIKLVKHINMLNPIANEFSWEYVFFDRMLSDEMIDLSRNLYIKIDYLLITFQMPLKPYVSRLFGISCFGRCS